MFPRVLCFLFLSFHLSKNHLTFGYPPGSAPLTYENDPYGLNSKCIDPETGRDVYVGEAFTRSGRCIRVQCLGDLQMWEDRCQIPHLEGNCYRIPAANEFLDYPRCCPTYECKSFKDEGNILTDATRTYDHYGRLLREHIINRVVNQMVHITTVPQNRTVPREHYYPHRYGPVSNSTSVFQIN